MTLKPNLIKNLTKFGANGGASGFQRSPSSLKQNNGKEPIIFLRTQKSLNFLNEFVNETILTVNGGPRVLALFPYLFTRTKNVKV